MSNEEALHDSAGVRKYDLVVFGASGFTGQFVVEEIARTMHEEQMGGSKIKWAIAGRNIKKLQDVLDTATRITGVPVTDIPIILADVDSESSVLEMCQQAVVIINCVGPYRLYGTVVVKACIESGTHHIDICGETGWLEEIQLVFNSKAKETGSYIIQACGFDSIPSEMGIVYTKQKFNGVLNSVECFFNIHWGNEGGARVNHGTWDSAIHSLGNTSELRNIRRQLYTTQLPKSRHRLAKRSLVFYSDEVGGWCLPFLGADRAIVYRTMMHNHENRQQKPIQFQPYSKCSSFFGMLCTILAGLMFGLLTRFNCGKNLLQKHPKIMSLGFISKEGPSRKQIEQTSFDVTFVGLGYESSEDESAVPNKKIVTKLHGPEMGYVTTPICVVQAAYVLLKEKSNLPKGGGVFTPGAAFADTSLIERLEDHNMKFSVVQQ